MGVLRRTLRRNSPLAAFWCQGSLKDSHFKFSWSWPDVCIFTKSGFTTLTTDWIGQILISQNGGDTSRFTRWKYIITAKVSSKVTWFIRTTQHINGSLKSRPAGTIFVSNVAIMKTRPSSMAIRNEIFSPDFTGIKIAIIDTQPRISIGSTIVNVVCLYFRCGINNTTCWPEIALSSCLSADTGVRVRTTLFKPLHT